MKGIHEIEIRPNDDTVGKHEDIVNVLEQTTMSIPYNN
jgi:hypothetical protein